jgi:hypothetical protein
MIFTAILNLVVTIFDVLLSFLPTWTVWPAFVERGAVLVGQYSYWLDAWAPMKTFWAIILVDASFFSSLLFACIFSRALRLKIFKH